MLSQIYFFFLPFRRKCGERKVERFLLLLLLLLGSSNSHRLAKSLTTIFVSEKGIPPCPYLYVISILDFPANIAPPYLQAGRISAISLFPPLRVFGKAATDIWHFVSGDCPPPPPSPPTTPLSSYLLSWLAFQPPPTPRFPLPQECVCATGKFQISEGQEQGGVENIDELPVSVSPPLAPTYLWENGGSRLKIQGKPVRSFVLPL